MRAQLVGGDDAAATGIVRQLVLDLQKALPEIGAAGSVFAKQCVIAERIAKEAEPVEPTADAPHPPATRAPFLSPLMRGEGLVSPSPHLRGEGWGEGPASAVVAFSCD
jgi:hypothetical protein